MNKEIEISKIIYNEVSYNDFRKPQCMVKNIKKVSGDKI